MSKKNKDKKDELDTQTTFADMNVEGFRWYDPSRKKDGTRRHRQKVSRKEYWQMVRGAFAAMLPFFLVIICVFGIIMLIAWLWVGR